MTDIPIFISSVNGIRNSQPHDFVVSFTTPITLDPNKNHFIALDSLDMSYSWYNVSSSAYSNNTLKYSPDAGANWFNIVFPDGNFTYSDISNYVKSVLEKNNHSKTGIKLVFIHTVLRVLIELENNYQVDLSHGNFARLIGFDKGIVNKTGYGQNEPNITNSVDNINVHTNLITNSIVSSNENNVLYRFSVDNLSLSYPF